MNVRGPIPFARSFSRPLAMTLATSLLLLVAASRGLAADPLPEAAAVSDPGGDNGAAEANAQAPVIQTLGSGDRTLHLVDHGDTWSMHAENVQAAAIFDAWHQVGGPEVISKIVLDFPYTLSMHRATTERIVERILEGYGHTLHYDAAGRLERVRVYSPEPARMFKTPRLVESLGSWRQAENEAASPAGGTDAQQAPGAASPTAP